MYFNKYLILLCFVAILDRYFEFLKSVRQVKCGHVRL